MKLFLMLALLAAPLTPKQQARRARAEKMCKAQGPRCHVLRRAGQPRDLTGVSCVCDH